MTSNLQSALCRSGHSRPADDVDPAEGCQCRWSRDRAPRSALSYGSVLSGLTAGRSVLGDARSTNRPLVTSPSHPVREDAME